MRDEGNTVLKQLQDTAVLLFVKLKVSRGTEQRVIQPGLCLTVPRVNALWHMLARHWEIAYDSWVRINACWPSDPPLNLCPAFSHNVQSPITLDVLRNPHSIGSQKAKEILVKAGR